LEWLSNVCQVDGCPLCKSEVIPYGPDTYLPFIKHLTNKELDKRAMLTKPMAKQIKEFLEGISKEESPKIVVFVDDKYADLIDLAKQILRNPTGEEKITE
jgi:hypothetical protein